MHHRRLLTFLTLTTIICLTVCGRADAFSPALSVIYSFTNELSPDAEVVQGANGHFYGVATTGGTSNYGGIYEVTSNGALVTNIWFNGANGAAPMGALVQDSSGYFYGTTSRGGLSNNGTVFQMTSSGQFGWQTNFNGTNGTSPQGPLVLGTNGLFYGTTFSGGINGLGTIFSVSRTGMLSNVFSFDSRNGANPATGVVLGSNGNLYGTTAYGGSGGLGTVFEWSSSNGLTTLYSFSGSAGAFPGGLAEDANSNFYGTTVNGGTNFEGTLFELTSNSTFATLVTFDLFNGANPNSPLMPGNAGGWYGTTEQGGVYGLGTIFILNTNGIVSSGRHGGFGGSFGGESAGGLLTNAFSFDGTNGAWPRSGLSLGNDGNYYGTTSAGGANGYGEIYELSGFPPYIIKQPVNQSYASNHSATFSVSAGGSTPLSYQWQFDGTNVANDIPGATNASLVVNREQLTNSGTYTVIVSNAFGVASSSAILTVVSPTVTIDARSETVTNSPTTISGTAADPNGIAAVLCQLNSNGWSAASGTVHWQTNLTLLPGTNLFQAQSFDPLGNPSAIKSINIFYALTSPLTLQTNGSGKITGEINGAMLDIGRGYTVAAVPGSHYVFSNWTSSTGFTSNSATLHFIMESNLTLTASFVTNLFVGAAGTYNGLFYQTDGNGVTEQTAGMLRNLTIRSNAAYSGTLLLDGAPYTLRGSFNLSGFASNYVARSTTKGGPVAVSMTVDWTSGQITGSVSGSNLEAWSSPLAAEMSAAPSPSAQSTILLTPGANATGEIPPGYGYLLITNHNGNVTLNGALADGTTFSQAVPLGVSNEVPVYASLYGNTGLLLGWLGLSNATLEVETNLAWIKPAARLGIYTNGFTNLLTGLGSAWTKPPVGYTTNGTLVVSNNNLALDFSVTITNTTLLKGPSSPTNSLTGTFYPNTGLLKITFGNGIGKSTTTGYAAILGNSTEGGGYFITKTNAGMILFGQ